MADEIKYYNIFLPNTSVMTVQQYCRVEDCFCFVMNNHQYSVYIDSVGQKAAIRTSSLAS